MSSFRSPRAPRNLETPKTFVGVSNTLGLSIPDSTDAPAVTSVFNSGLAIGAVAGIVVTSVIAFYQASGTTKTPRPATPRTVTGGKTTTVIYRK